MGHGSDKAQKARDRNWRIKRLRGIWANTCICYGQGNQRAIELAIDNELRNMGAEPETERRARWDKHYYKDPSRMSTEEFVAHMKEQDKIYKPWGGKEFEPLWAKELRELYTK